MQEKVIFRNIGGSFQYSADRPEVLPEILNLDPALWAALCAPVGALNGNRKFLAYLDSDHNGLIRVDEVRLAVRQMTEALKSLAPLADPSPSLAISELNDDSEDGRALLEFIRSGQPDLAEGETLKLDLVSARLAAVNAGPFRGDGILTADAVAGSGAETLFADVLKISGGAVNAAGKSGITAAQLEKFVADAQAFLAWAREAERPEFRGEDPVPFFEPYNSLKNKLDEFFSFCDLIRIDPANALRFKLDPAKLPELNLIDPAAVASVIAHAPLTSPNAEGVLNIDGEVNPAFRAALAEFAAAFGIERLTAADWAALKRDMAPYENYLAKAQGDKIAGLGRIRLQNYLDGSEVGLLRDGFARDGRLGTVLTFLKKLEMVILYKQYLWGFVNNFVNFQALFDPRLRSLLQAGKLIMDGHTYSLTLWIRNVAEHKKIAVQSNLCMLYLELVQTTPPGPNLYVAVAVTGGGLNRIYIGKPAFFIDMAGRHYSGRVVDVVEGPIAFWQTILAPFRRLAGMIGGKIQKLTDFAGVEKNMAKSIDDGEKMLTAPPPAQPAKGGFLNNGSVMLLAGGLSIAALGAAASFVAKTFVSIIETIAHTPPLRLLLWVGIVFLAFFLPAAINAMLKLRKRNLTLFLEAAGWAVNLPMRLSAGVSRLFTAPGIYPPQTEFRLRNCRSDRHFRRLTRWFGSLIVILLLLAAAAYVARRMQRQRAVESVSQEQPVQQTPSPEAAAAPAAAPESR